MSGLKVAKPSAGLEVKVCGLKEPAHVEAAADGGAYAVGFVFFPRSPRAVTPEQAGALAGFVPPGVLKVGVVVDPDDALLDGLAARAELDVLQLHGRETVERGVEVKRRTGLRLARAIAVSGPDDLAKAEAWGGVADLLLFDAKPPKNASLPGGNGLSFDWPLLKAFRSRTPWLLAGGLHLGNLNEAVEASGARGVDASSGLETAPGVKDTGLIAEFLARARSIGARPGP